MTAPAHFSTLRRGLALGVSLALAVPAGAMAVPTTATAATAAPEDPALGESREMYDEGKARFDTFDYEGAVEMWTKAYARLPVDAAGVRNAMVYNIATAQEKAYELDKDVQHLRQAVLLLESYVKNYKVLYKRTPETAAEVDKAEARIAALKERIAQAERGEAPPPAAVVAPTQAPPGASGSRYGSGEVDGIAWSTGHNPPPDPALVKKNRMLAAEERKTDRMLIGSYVALSLGGVFALAGGSALLGASLAESLPEDDPEIGPDGEPLPGEEDPNAGDGARGAGYGLLAVGLAGLVTGVALIVVGMDRRKKARQGTLVAGTPTFGPGFAGASLRVRF